MDTRPETIESETVTAGSISRVRACLSAEMTAAASLVLCVLCAIQSHSGEVVAWGGGGASVTNVPRDLTNVVSLGLNDLVAGAVLADGRAVTWDRTSGNSVPVPSVTNAVAIVGGLVLTADNTLVAFGSYTNIPDGLTNVVAISRTFDNTLALRSDGTVVSWSRAVASGETSVPLFLREVVAVSAGAYYSLALKADGTIVAWGDNGEGTSTVPPDATNVIAISAGRYHALALRADGTVVGWGEDRYGKATPPAGLSNVVAIAAARNHSLALKADGTLVQWGYTNEVPPAMSNVVAIVGGHSCGMALKGTALYQVTPTLISARFAVGVAGKPLQYRMWAKNGSTHFAAEGLPAGLSLEPVSGVISGVPESPGIYDISLRATNDAGVGHSAVRFYINTPVLTLTSRRNATAFPGVPFAYQVTLDNGPADIHVTGLPSWLSFDAGTHLISGVPPLEFTPYTLTVAASNHLGLDAITVPLNVTTVVAFGDNQYGATSVPTNAGHVVAVAASAPGTHALGLRADGTVVAWGSGRPGWSERGQTNVPPGLSNVVAIAAGFDQSLALKSDRTVVGWGNYAGTFAGLTNVAAIAAGYSVVGLLTDGRVVGSSGADRNHSNLVALAVGWDDRVGIRTDGTVEAWGNNSYGQTNVPPGLSNVVAIGAGNRHCLAVKSDGSVVVWGQTNTTLPTTRLSNLVRVAGGGYHSVALREDGTVVGWGESYWGKTTSPLGLSNVVGIAAGDNFSLAVVGIAPTVLRQAQTQRSVTSTNVVLHPGVVAAVPAACQWFKDNQLIAGGTHAALQWSHLSRTNSGTYFVVVSNAFGTVVSSNTLVRMMPPTALDVVHFDNGFSFRIRDPEGVPLGADDLTHFEVQSTTNLVHWPALSALLTLDGGNIRVTDPAATHTSGRYYRVMER